MKLINGRKILVIDDDPILLKLLALAIKKAGAIVYQATNGPDGLALLAQHHPDVVILDIMMPRMSGWEVCQQIREHSNVLILMLTALNENSNMVRGLDSGADEYLTKPVDYEVLLARLRALLRRAEGHLPAPQTSYEDGYLTIDLDHHQVDVAGSPVKLSKTEFNLLTYLIQHPNKVLPFDQILANVWGPGTQDHPQYVHIYMANLRKKIEADPDSPRYILNERGIGYRFQMS